MCIDVKILYYYKISFKTFLNNFFLLFEDKVVFDRFVNGYLLTDELIEQLEKNQFIFKELGKQRFMMINFQFDFMKYIYMNIYI